LAAQDAIAPYFKKAIDNDCFPHTMNNVPIHPHLHATVASLITKPPLKT